MHGFSLKTWTLDQKTDWVDRSEEESEHFYKTTYDYSLEANDERVFTGVHQGYHTTSLVFTTATGSREILQNQDQPVG